VICAAVLCAAERFALLQEYTVVQGDRLDNLAARFIGDPERFWQICGANAATRPEELTEIVGRILRITLPEGIPQQPSLTIQSISR